MLSEKWIEFQGMSFVVVYQKGLRSTPNVTLISAAVVCILLVCSSLDLCLRPGDGHDILFLLVPSM